MFIPARDPRDYSDHDIAIFLSYRPKINDGKFREVPNWLIEEAIKRLGGTPPYSSRL